MLGDIYVGPLMNASLADRKRRSQKHLPVPERTSIRFSLLPSPTSQEDKNKEERKAEEIQTSRLLVQQNKPFIRLSLREDWRSAVGVAESRSLSGGDLKPQIEAQSGEKGENRESNQIISVSFMLVIFSVHLTKINAHIMTTRIEEEGAAHGQMSLTAPGLAFCELHLGF